MGNVSGSESKFDQAAWCREHASKVDTTNVQTTFHYVKWNHPFFGCAKHVNQLPTFTGQETLEQLAEIADAVTVLCVQQLDNEGMGWDQMDTPEQLLAINSTGIANTAYLALHHDNPKIRNAAAVVIQRWRLAKNDQLRPIPQK